MLSGVLRSKTAVAVNIAIMRAFVELRRAATSYTAIERRPKDLARGKRARGSPKAPHSSVFWGHLRAPEVPKNRLGKRRTGLLGALQSRLHRFDSGRRLLLLPISSDPVINYFPFR